MKLNNEGLALIKLFEGLKLKAYKDVVGIWTIGYGHTCSVQEDDVISKEQAEKFLLDDLRIAEFAVKSLVTLELTDNEYSALVSFVYNVGVKALKDSTLLKLLNFSDRKGAAEEFLRWNKAGGKVIAGLTSRRKAERELFLSPAVVGATAC